MNTNVYMMMAVFVVGVLLAGCAPEMPEDQGGLPEDPAGGGGAGDFPDEPAPAEPGDMPEQPDDFPEGGEPIGEPIQ